ncbi:MAG: hypothetical protein KDA28_15520, partial [Phycisphaerales bacterium]|nr:hypothetical protein [Phycisphaerales bacterium]
DVVVFEQGWAARDLTRDIGAPKAIDDVIVWTDPKDALVAGAYPSADGLVLLRRDGGGTWTWQNLASELPGARVPVRSLTQFVSGEGTGQVVVIAGIAADGSLVAYRQTGAQVGSDWSYAFDDISADLTAQGMATPELDGLISYRPAWDAWHLAGLTPEGEIVSVWVAPSSFQDWRLDNLSDVTGAQPLAGGLSVILTSWSGINLTGLDDDGHVIVTWWVPAFGGDWNANDLTTDFEAPVLTGGVLTSYYTSWDGMNYAGLNELGEVTIYWWVPQLAGSWEVSVVTQGQPGIAERPAGGLTSHASDGGTLNIFGADEDGDVVRVWWAPGAAWTLENLSETATRV